MKTQRAFLARLSALLSICLLCALAIFDTLQNPDGITVSLLRATHAVTPRPSIFGSFHLTMLGLFIALVVLLLLLRHKIDGKHLDSIVFVCGLVLLVMEVYKQLYWWAILGNGHYNFGILPLQFCSYALYLFLLIPLLPEGRVKDALYAFCALYQTMGGCIVMAYPMLYTQVALSYHTMIWHTLMIGVGVLILCKRSYGKRFLREMLPTAAVFLLTMAVATAGNLWLTPYAALSPQPLNLFYMSPYQTNSYILISDVRNAFGWFPSLLCYAMLFVCVGATVMWGLGRAVWLWDRHNSAKRDKGALDDGFLREKR